ncbi:hypothetical protein THRCLA_00770 [Thraustotheca clavata]|uniref:Uncharacterized protein n=1 Tax=Thraustotheca clavata TaxID=74557 RepID=A0A1W0AAL5_9STRA|nr:hypothetical protein THRCLA_00770 [Thraustotheca clavata]
MAICDLLYEVHYGSNAMGLPLASGYVSKPSSQLKIHVATVSMAHQALNDTPLATSASPVSTTLAPLPTVTVTPKSTTLEPTTAPVTTTPAPTTEAPTLAPTPSPTPTPTPTTDSPITPEPTTTAAPTTTVAATTRTPKPTTTTKAPVTVAPTISSLSGSNASTPAPTQKASTGSSDNNSNNIYLYIGLGAGGFVLVVLIVFIAMKVRDRDDEEDEEYAPSPMSYNKSSGRNTDKAQAFNQTYGGTPPKPVSYAYSKQSYNNPSFNTTPTYPTQTTPGYTGNNTPGYPNQASFGQTSSGYTAQSSFGPSFGGTAVPMSRVYQQQSQAPAQYDTTDYTTHQFYPETMQTSPGPRPSQPPPPARSFRYEEPSFARLLLSVALANDTSICQKDCYPGGPGNGKTTTTISASVATLTAPCFQLTGGDIPSCFGYGTTPGVCPFNGMTDCSKATKTTTSAPSTTPPSTTTGAANTTTVVPTTGTSSSTDHRLNEDSQSSSSGTGKIWPYVVGGGVALVAIAILVIVMVKKSSRSAEEDEIDTVEYAKPIPTSSSGNFKNDGQMPIPRPGYNNSFIQPPPPTAMPIPEAEKPFAARANPSFNQGPVVRQNPSFLNRTQSNTYGNAFPQAQVVPPVYTTNASFGPNAAPIRRESHEAGRVEPQAPMPKEQFYVPQVELHFGEHEEPSGRRESLAKTQVESRCGYS